MNIKIDINNCRVCLQSGKGQPLFGASTRYDQKYTLITQLPAFAGDGLPELICAKCVARLRIACEFRTNAQTSEQHVRRFLAATNSGQTEPADETDEELEQRLLAEAYAAEEPQQQEPDEADEEAAAAVEQQPAVAEPQPVLKLEPKSSVSPPKESTHVKKKLQRNMMPPPPHPVVLKRMQTRGSAPAAPETEQPTADSIVPVALHCAPGARKRPATAETTATVGAQRRDKAGGAPTAQPQRASARHAAQRRQQPTQLPPIDRGTSPTMDIGAMKIEATDDSHSNGDAAAAAAADDNNADDQSVDQHDDDVDSEILFEISTDNELDDDMNEEHLMYEEESNAGADDSYSAAPDDYDVEITVQNEDADDDDDRASTVASAAAATGDPLQPPAAKRQRRTSAALTTLTTSVGVVHVCQHCNKDFSTRTNLLRHIQTHDGSKPYKCTLCDSAFTQNGSLKQHMHIHTGSRPFTCEFCGRGFTQSKSMTFHMRRHTGEKPFVCKECGMTFRQKDGLKRHIVVRHPDGAPVEFHCDQCPKVLRSRYSLNVHRKRHSERQAPVARPPVNTADADAESDGGGGGGGGGGDTKKLPFSCEQCTRSFASQASLVAHRRQHPMERETRCPQCDAAFSTRLQQQNHMRTVHGEGPAGGKVAGIEELEPESEMEKPFVCGECGLGFAQDSYRAVHARTVHGKRCKKFECPTCGKSYAIKANLNAHIARHENDELMQQQENSVEQLDEVYDEADYEEEDDDDDDGGDGENEQQQQNQLQLQIAGDGDDAAVASGDIIELEYITDENDHADQQGKPIFECNGCNVGFTNSADLVQHRRDEHGVMELTDEACMCDSCELIFSDIADLEAHIVMHHSDQMVSLDEVATEETAAAAVVASAEAAETVEAASEASTFKCDRCEVVLDSQRALDEHVLEHDLTDAK